MVRSYYETDLQVQVKPTKPQIATFQAWLELARRQYNFRLGQRFDWYEATRTPVNACPLVVNIVPIEEIYRDIPLTRPHQREA